MIAKHSVKVNGVWYRAGEEISSSASFDVSNTTETNIEESVEKQSQPQYTKTDINRMPVDELRKLAMSTGVEGADKWTGAELKEYLIALMGL